MRSRSVLGLTASITLIALISVLGLACGRPGDSDSPARKTAEGASNAEAPPVMPPVAGPSQALPPSDLFSAASPRAEETDADRPQAPAAPTGVPAATASAGRAGRAPDPIRPVAGSRVYTQQDLDRLLAQSTPMPGPGSSPAPPTPAGDRASAPAYTNEDLERLFGATAPPAAGEGDEATATKDDAPAAPAGARSLTPLQELENEQARLAAATLQQEKQLRAIAELEAKVRALEQRELAVRNPYLPRPDLPPDEAKVWQGLTAAQRIERIEAQLAAARLELAELKKRTGAR